LRLLPAGSGGLQSPMPTGTQSQQLVFPSLEDPAGEVKVGGVIDVIGGPALVPGADEVPVVIRYWTDEAAVYATPGAVFTLWHGRAVGAGVVTRLVDEVAGD
jgi:hypothetical protein